MNTPDRPHWTINSCFGVPRSVWVHFGLFHYCTKLVAKRVELVQLVIKFMPRSRIGIFCNKCTRSTPLGHNSCFGASCSVWMYFGLFRYCTKLDTKQAELVQLMQKFVPRSCIEFFRTNAPDPPHWTLKSCFGASRRVWVQLSMFRYYMKLGGKRVDLVQLMHKFVP